MSALIAATGFACFLAELSPEGAGFARECMIAEELVLSLQDARAAQLPLLGRAS